jgi:hypothetical protein
LIDSIIAVVAVPLPSAGDEIVKEGINIVVRLPVASLHSIY